MNTTPISNRSHFVSRTIRSICIFFILLANGCGFDPFAAYAVIPVRTRFPDEIWFTGNEHDVSSQFKDSYHPYVMVKWKVSGTPTANTIPPFGVEIDGKTFNSEDFLFKTFSQSGALDSRRVENPKSSEESINKNLRPILTYIDRTANIRIKCRYTNQETLESIELLIENKGDGINPPTLPQKEIKIITSRGTVILPANYRTLVKTLGEPLEHIPQHLYKPDHII